MPVATASTEQITFRIVQCTEWVGVVRVGVLSQEAVCLILVGL